MIASGTGPLHIAAALGTSTLGLFPPIRPIHPGRWAPLGLKAETLVQAEDCQRCTGPTDCACMNNITPDSVAKIALRWHANKQPAEMAGLEVA